MLNKMKINLLEMNLLKKGSQKRTGFPNQNLK